MLKSHLDFIKERTNAEKIIINENKINLKLFEQDILKIKNRDIKIYIRQQQ